jgi:hypothetical protein
LSSQAEKGFFGAACWLVCAASGNANRTAKRALKIIFPIKDPPKALDHGAQNGAVCQCRGKCGERVPSQIAKRNSPWRRGLYRRPRSRTICTERADDEVGGHIGTFQNEAACITGRGLFLNIGTITGI